MKLLLLACLIGFAAADLLQDAAPAIDQAVNGFLEGALSAGSLSKALGINDPAIEQMAEDVESELARMIREALKEMLEKIKDHVENGKAVGQELLEKVKELKDKLKDLGDENSEKIRDMLKSIREKAKEALRKILERLGLGKRNLDDSLDQIARMKFRDIVEKIKDKILSNENIQKIRDYIKNHVSDSELVHKLKEVMEKMSDVDLKEILSFFLEHQPQTTMERTRAVEAWNKVKEFFRDLNVKIQEHSKKFGQWVKEMWNKGIDKLKEKHGTIKAIAMEFIANAKDMSAEMSREALEFFRPYKDDLGSLWNQLVDASKEAIGKF